MALTFGDNISYQGKKPLDSRSIFKTIADMKAYSENYLPPLAMCQNEEDGKTYTYNVNNEVNELTGKWRVLQGEGGGTADVPIEKIKVNGELQTPVNKVVDITVPEAYDDTDIRTELAKKADTDHTHTTVNGHTVESDVPVDAKFTDTVYDDTQVKTQIQAVANGLMDSVGYSADYKTIDIIAKNGVKKSVNVAPIISHASITELSDVDTTNKATGKALVYNATTSKHEYADVSGTDEKVKMDSSTDAKYLGELLDNITIANENGELKVKKLDGQEVTITEINYLKGLTMNVMDLVNMFSNGGVKIINTPVATYAELLTLDKSAFIEGISYLVYVLADENHDNAKTTYLVDKDSETPTYFGFADSQRDFTTNPIDLATEITGKLGIANMDSDAIKALFTVDDTYKTETATNNAFSTHGAKALYDELLLAIGGKANDSDFTTHRDDTSIHVSTTEKETWNKAQENVIETVNVNGSALTPTDKAVDITVPTTVAELTDSSSYAKKTEIPTTLPANGGNADTVNNHTVESDVPENAKFTDTIYDDTEVKGSIAELNSNLGELANTWLKGKTINFLGDSITKGSWYLNGEWQGYMEKPYPTVIANIVGCTSNNFGESGTPIRHNSSNTGFVDRVSNFPSADMNVMFGGVNDLTGGTLGDENSTDINTIYGALKVIAQTFISKNPKSINVFISPLMSNITGGAIKYDEIRRAIKYVANLYGFVFIDASVEAPMMNPNVPELNDIWLNGNLVHPNPEYHEILGKWLAYKLASLESSGSINSNVTNVGCKYLPEVRSSGHTYLKITWDNISNASELSIRFILSYGGELVINGNPYYDKSYTLTASTTSIKALLLDNSHWNPSTDDIISNIYVVENAIYVKFTGAVAFTPIVLGCVDTFGISMEWDDAWEGISASTDRELVIKKTPYVCDIGEVGGETIKDTLINLSIVTLNKVYLQANIPFLISSYYKGNTIFALASIDDNGIYLFDVTYKDGKYRMVYKPNEYRNIFKVSETEV